MNMDTAIAYSFGNKAKAINDIGGIVIVQRQVTMIYSPSLSLTVERWYYIWYIQREFVTEMESADKALLRTYYSVDPDADYWSAL